MTTAAGSVPTRVRLAELVAALSLGVDLGFGQPMEHVLRQCVIALRTAGHLHLDERERSVVYYTALLVNVGCHTDAHEQAKWFGDDIALKAGKYAHDLHGLRAAAASLRLVGSGHQGVQRARIGMEFALRGHRELDGMIEQHAALARDFAQRLGLSDDVQEAVGSSYEQWDGRGWPGQCRGEQVPMASRLTQLAEFTEVAHRVGGVPAAVTLASRRAGRQFDPRLSAALCAHADEIFDGIDATRTWDAVIALEPALGVWLTEDRLDGALRAIADFVDLKSPYMLGHGHAVSELAAGAGTLLRRPAGEIPTLRRAGLLLGLGRLGVSNAIWDKPGPLGAGEWERVRMHPYLTERMLCQSAVLAPLGAAAVLHRERLDGSGYPRGLSGAAIPQTGRILAAADAYRSMREPRPHRPALAVEAAAAELRAEVSAGRLDRDAVDAVLRTAGHGVVRRLPGPAGLTAREIEVLRLLARGLSTKEISGRLVITTKTARNHIEHIYTKTGASSRVTASLYAMQQGLLLDEPS